MSMSARDKKLAMLIIPVALVVAFWFLVLSPKREEARKAGEALTAQQQRRDDAVAKLASLGTAQTSFATDYATVVRLGKAIPSSVDEPSLLVQLDRAARGTGIKFQSVKAAEGGAEESSASGSAAGSSSGSGGAAGATSTTTSTTAKAGEPAGGAAAGGAKAPGLENVPLEFEFEGTYFDLTRFFHRMKRFVYVRGDGLRVRGRLMTLDSLKITDEEPTTPGLTAEIKATVYTTPKAEGMTGGATPEGPAGQSASASASTTSAGSAGSSSTPPTAVATP